MNGKEIGMEVFNGLILDHGVSPPESVKSDAGEPACFVNV